MQFFDLGNLSIQKASGLASGLDLEVVLGWGYPNLPPKQRLEFCIRA